MLHAFRLEPGSGIGSKLDINSSVSERVVWPWVSNVDSTPSADNLFHTWVNSAFFKKSIDLLKAQVVVLGQQKGDSTSNMGSSH